MANTTNLNLVKPAGTDFALVSVINGNMDIIDSKVGAIPANESAQSQITALNNQTTALQSGLAYIVGTTNTTGKTLPIGTYLYVKDNGNGIADGLYTAKIALGAGYQITSDRVQAISDGALNQLQSRTLLCDATPNASTPYNLSDSVLNYNYIEIIFVKSGGGGGAFVNRIIHHDSLAVGTQESLSFSTYNNSSYNFYAECGFSQNNIFNISTYRSTGWTMTKLYIVGIGRMS